MHISSSGGQRLFSRLLYAKLRMAATFSSAGVVEVLVSFYKCGEENAFEKHRSRIPIGKEQGNITDAKKHFLGISQMATSLGI